MVAKLGDVKPATKSELRQALRCKVNSLKFYSSKPGYFLGKIFINKFIYIWPNSTYMPTNTDMDKLNQL